MKCSIELKISTKQVEEGMLELANKLRISVRYYHLGATVQSKDVVNEDLGIFHGCDLFFASSEVVVPGSLY